MKHFVLLCFALLLTGCATAPKGAPPPPRQEADRLEIVASYQPATADYKALYHVSIRVLDAAGEAISAPKVATVENTIATITLADEFAMNFLLRNRTETGAELELRYRSATRKVDYKGPIVFNQVLNLKALKTTEKELADIASAQNAGLKDQPNQGKNTPAAKGSPSAL